MTVRNKRLKKSLRYCTSKHFPIFAHAPCMPLANWFELDNIHLLGISCTNGSLIGALSTCKPTNGIYSKLANHRNIALCVVRCSPIQTRKIFFKFGNFVQSSIGNIRRKQIFPLMVTNGLLMFGSTRQAIHLLNKYAEFNSFYISSIILPSFLIMFF